MRVGFEGCSSVISTLVLVKHTLTSCVPPPEENAVVWYSLLPGPGYELFSINPYTGLITTTSYLDREQQQYFTLRGRTHEHADVNTWTHKQLKTVTMRDTEVWAEIVLWNTLLLWSCLSLHFTGLRVTCDLRKSYPFKIPVEEKHMDIEITLVFCNVFLSEAPLFAWNKSCLH